MTVPEQEATEPTPTTGPPGAGPLIAVAVTLVLWASAFVAIRHLMGPFDAGPLSLGRLLVGAVALGAVSLTRTWVRPTRGEWTRIVAIGLLWYAFYNVALNAGERLVDAGTAALLIQLSPVLVALLAVPVLGERFTATLGAGLVLAGGGVALITLGSDEATRFDPVGVALVLAAAAAYAVSAILQKPLVARLAPLQVTWLACSVGALACLPWLGTLVGQVADASAAEVGWVVYLGIFPTAIAFTTFAYALTHMSTSSLAVTTYLVPPITIVMSLVLLGETPATLAYVGGALALVGVAVARHQRR